MAMADVMRSPVAIVVARALGPNNRLSWFIRIQQLYNDLDLDCHAGPSPAMTPGHKSSLNPLGAIARELQTRLEELRLVGGIPVRRQKESTAPSGTH